MIQYLLFIQAQTQIYITVNAIGHTKGIWSISGSFSWSMIQFTASSSEELPEYRELEVISIFKKVVHPSKYAKVLGFPP